MGALGGFLSQSHGTECSRMIAVQGEADGQKRKGWIRKVGGHAKARGELKK